MRARPVARFDQCQNLHLVVERALDRRALQTTDESLVDLDNAAANAERAEVSGAHRFAYTVGEEPSRLVGDLKGAVKLVGADTLLATGHQEHGL